MNDSPGQYILKNGIGVDGISLCILLHGFQPKLIHTKTSLYQLQRLYMESLVFNHSPHWLMEIGPQAHSTTELIQQVIDSGLPLESSKS